MTSNDKKQMSDKTKKLYRKLSILFHPDKYTKTDKIFILITSCANNNEYDILEQIDALSSDILECPENLINKLIELLNDKKKLNNLYQYMQKENNSFINYIDGNIILDKNDKLWVISGGDSVPAKLQRINPLTSAVEISLAFENKTNPGNLCINKTKDTLYFLKNGVFRFPISSTTLPNVALVPANNRVYYGLGVNPKDYTIFAADALDYVQRSNIYIFDNKGNQLSFFKAGIISNGFYFE
jgi:hypothetical protein